MTQKSVRSRGPCTPPRLSCGLLKIVTMILNIVRGRFDMVEIKRRSECVMSVLFIVLWSKYSNFFPHSRAVITVGVEDEDRLDQWVEDAESVCFQFQFQYVRPCNLVKRKPLFMGTQLISTLYFR